MESIDAIKNYCEYLKNVAGFSITLHRMPQNTNAFFTNVLPIPNIHFNPYCTYLKQNLGLHPKCLECQVKAINKCVEEGSFAGVCHAGVFEYIYPVTLSGNVEAMLSVSDYVSENFEEYVDEICKSNDVEKEFLLSLRSTLKSDIPDKEYVDTLIIPLLTMIKNVSMLNPKEGFQRRNITPFRGILFYCDRFYTEKITIDFLSKRFYCSKSYIARTFKKVTGKSLPEYINNLRVRNAMQLLKSTNADIAQIGTTVGYDDPSYFTKCFVKIAGITPKKWRNLNKPQE